MSNPVCKEYKVAAMRSASETLNFDKNIAKSTQLIETAVEPLMDQK